MVVAWRRFGAFHDGTYRLFNVHEQQYTQHSSPLSNRARANNTNSYINEVNISERN